MVNGILDGQIFLKTKKFCPCPSLRSDYSTAQVTFIASHQPLPFAARVPSLTDTQVNPQSLFVRPMMIAIGWLTGLLALAGLSAALWGEKGVCPLLGTALVAALALHGSLLWTAAVGVSKECHQRQMMH